MNSLQKLRNLKGLEFDGSRVSDERLPFVMEFPALKALHLRRAGVADAEILALQQLQQRPQMEVKR